VGEGKKDLYTLVGRGSLKKKYSNAIRAGKKKVVKKRETNAKRVGKGGSAHS